MRPDHRVVSLAIRTRPRRGDLVVAAEPGSGGCACLDRPVERRRVVALERAGRGRRAADEGIARVGFPTGHSRSAQDFCPCLFAFFGWTNLGTGSGSVSPLSSYISANASSFASRPGFYGERSRRPVRTAPRPIDTTPVAAACAQPERRTDPEGEAKAANAAPAAGREEGEGSGYAGCMGCGGGSGGGGECSFGFGGGAPRDQTPRRPSRCSSSVSSTSRLRPVGQGEVFGQRHVDVRRRGGGRHGDAARLERLVAAGASPCAPKSPLTIELQRMRLSAVAIPSGGFVRDVHDRVGAAVAFTTPKPKRPSGSPRRRCRSTRRGRSGGAPNPGRRRRSNCTRNTRRVPGTARGFPRTSTPDFRKT